MDIFIAKVPELFILGVVNSQAFKDKEKFYLDLRFGE